MIPLRPDELISILRPEFTASSGSPGASCGWARDDTGIIAPVLSSDVVRIGAPSSDPGADVRVTVKSPILEGWGLWGYDSRDNVRFMVGDTGVAAIGGYSSPVDPGILMVSGQTYWFALHDHATVYGKNGYNCIYGEVFVPKLRISGHQTDTVGLLVQPTLGADSAQSLSGTFSGVCVCPYTFAPVSSIDTVVGIQVASPSFEIAPSTVRGIHVRNQSVTGVSATRGIEIDEQAGEGDCVELWVHGTGIFDRLVQVKNPEAAGIALDHNSATGDYTVYLSPSNLTDNRRFIFPNVDGTVVVGSGTPNYIPRWSGYSLIDSSITDTGSYIAINQQVIVNGAANTVQLYVRAYTTQTADIMQISNSSGVSFVRVTNAGCIAIGANFPTTPAAPLDMVTNSSYEAIRVFRHDNIYQYFRIWFDISSGWQYQAVNSTIAFSGRQVSFTVAHGGYSPMFEYTASSSQYYNGDGCCWWRAYYTYAPTSGSYLHRSYVLAGYVNQSGGTANGDHDLLSLHAAYTAFAGSNRRFLVCKQGLYYQDTTWVFAVYYDGATIIGGNVHPTAQLQVVGNTDRIQCLIKGYNTQTSDLMRITDSSDSTRAQVTSSGTLRACGVEPVADDTYYLGSASIPLAWRGVILRDTVTGDYYRVEMVDGTLTATLL